MLPPLTLFHTINIWGNKLVLAYKGPVDVKLLNNTGNIKMLKMQTLSVYFYMIYLILNSYHLTFDNTFNN